jgi:hypothetical protein
LKVKVETLKLKKAAEERLSSKPNFDMTNDDLIMAVERFQGLK